MPAISEPRRAHRSAGQVARHAQGVVTAAMNTKKIRPSSATGTPKTTDCGLVVTFSQLMTPVSGQASVTAVA
jgi:hypothetical protein